MLETTNEERWSVYIHTNKINNKVYIGIAKGNCKKRWQNGKGYNEKSQPIFAKAINKYGWDGFEHIIFMNNLMHDEAKHVEILLIALYKSNCRKYYNPSYGYNMTDGGDWNPMIGKHFTDEQKKKMSDSIKKVWENPERYQSMIERNKIRYLGENNPMYGKDVSEDTRKKIGNKSKEQWQNEEYRKRQLKHLQGEKNPFYGKHHSEKTKKKLSDKAKQRYAENSPPINRYTRAVVQLSPNKDFIAEFSSQKMASETTGVNKGNINNCCCNRHKSAGGYIWMYKEDWEKAQSTTQNELEVTNEL